MKQHLDFSSITDLIQMFIDNTPIAYIILDRNYRICYINESFAELRGLDRELVIGEKCYNISNAGIRCQHCAVAKALSTGEKAFVSRKDILPDCSVKFIDDYAIPLQKDLNGEVEFVLEIMINRTSEMLAKEQKNKDYDEILSLFSELLEAKDPYTAEHSSSVRRLAMNLAEKMELSMNEVFEITVAASLHDIGKIHIPESIIRKPSKLTQEEYELIKTHSEQSSKMLSGLSSFETVGKIVRAHHERIDGTGYPDKLKGEEIPIGAKIIAVADTYDAITSTRSYRNALTHEYALSEIRRVAGSQLDQQVVSAFLETDFDHLKEELYIPEDTQKNNQVERVIQIGQSDDEEKVLWSTGDRQIDMEKLLKNIFDNTPCGYILMDSNRKVLFASDYFLSYMGLTKEQLIGKICYEAGGIGAEPCAGCAIERALLTKQTQSMRQEQMTNNGPRIFDLFGVPLMSADQKNEYVIEIVIDRFEEVELERKREQDFSNLILLLEELLMQQPEEVREYELTKRIVSLRNRLNISKNPVT